MRSPGSSVDGRTARMWLAASSPGRADQIAGDFNYSIDVPEWYNPARAYQVRFQLHGGVMMRETGAPRTGRGGPMNVTLRGDEQSM